MIDARVPSIPSYDDDIEDQRDTAGGLIEVLAKRFAIVWYTFFDQTRNFLLALRNGPKQVQQSDLAALLAKMIQGKTQSGVQVWVPAPFNHQMRFTGTTWAFAPGDAGGGYRATFASPPSGDGWHLCDGTADVTYLLADGSLGTETLPNTAGLYFRR